MTGLGGDMANGAMDVRASSDNSNSDENYERIVSDRDFMNDVVNREVAEHAAGMCAVGDSVVVALPDGALLGGVIVDDYGDLAGQRVVISSDHTATTRRWAVETVERGVLFVDDEDLKHVVRATSAPADHPAAEA